MKILGITGPSGSGKTTLCSLIQKNYDAFIIDADNVAKSLSSNTETEYFRKMVNLFGNEVLRPDGNLNRKEVAKIIYNDNEKRKALNLLTFKYVVYDIENQIRDVQSSNYKYIAIDVPLLYEAKMENICDKVIAVVAEDKEKVLRICMRDNIDEKLARQRLQIQNNNEFFVKKADFVIHNDGTIDKLEKSLKEIIEKI
ncbi:MAG: dephospho-CoA kinase [Clostridia bacterium]|jgi:dephospho-CoA kinase|nr:dephospho-CoA kinase [Clostridia bacterium]